MKKIIFLGLLLLAASSALAATKTVYAEDFDATW